MRSFAPLALLLLTAASDPPEWVERTAPFQITENIYYVGTKGLAAYLIATPQGAILLDGTMERNVPAIEANIRAVGFKLRDVKILLNSHAHFDHAGGLAALKHDTGARLAAMAGDVPALQRGEHVGLTSYPRGRFPAVRVDRVLHDGDVVALGGVRMTALATPGHTRGCTTWVLPIARRAGRVTVVFPCSMTVAGNRLFGNTEYPAIVRHFRRSFDRIGALKADIVLTAHPEASDILTRRGTDYRAPGVLSKLVAEARAAFEVELTKQRGATRRKGLSGF
ncbi:subclass B3 metallo-beta-lactamase [Sphingomonas sp. MMS24-J45]|uniref:subclass B3 metallo-beta-lactamase n=1 Tax=Sphingomonas sp. MMS24-J45 TaxID=3238806 RepID=UPI00384EFD4E